MKKASACFEKLVAIDSMQASNIANNMPDEERRKIVEILISNQQIKETLLLQRGKSESNLDDDVPACLASLQIPIVCLCRSKNYPLMWIYSKDFFCNFQSIDFRHLIVYNNYVKR
jgi:hypothetical protein